MCLSANEPGGPKRCENYMRNVYGKVTALQRNQEQQKSIGIRLDSYKSRLETFRNQDRSQMTEQDSADLDRVIQQTENGTQELESSLSELQKDEPRLRQSATTAINNHKMETDRRKRMGYLVNEGGESELDNDKPYMSLAPQNFERFKNYISTLDHDVDYKMRTRMVPLELNDGSLHPFLTVPVKDVQFMNPDDDANLRRDSDEGETLGTHNKQVWNAPTANVLHSAWQISDKGKNYLSQRDVGESGTSTGALVRDTVYDPRNTAPQPEEDSEFQEFKKFAAQYPGDTAYAKKVRSLATKPFVGYKDASVLASAVSGFRSYKEHKRAPKLQRPQNSNSQRSQQRRGTPAQPQRRNEFMGEVGASIPDRQVRVTHIQEVPSQYGTGTGTMVLAADREGRVMKWISRVPVDNIGKGDTLSIRGTVKDHQNFQGTNQTVMSDCYYDVLSVA